MANKFDYEVEVKLATARGEVQGPLGIPGWKKASKATLTWCYLNGKLTVEQAVRLGLPLAAHLDYLASLSLPMQVTAVKLMGLLGVNLTEMDRVAKVRATKRTQAQAQVRACESESEHTEHDGHVLTEGEQAVKEHEERETAARVAALPGKKGIVIQGSDLPQDVQDKLVAEFNARIQAEKAKLIK